ncbi:MAG: N-acetylneuraminate synthase, partial [Rhodobiaceae bacterium]|nr:N-acetylneuraminate synthase [Rhodobiaceae bacterium]
IGYSGHETGLIVSCTAVALGATSVERHITLDRSMYGSDQSASIELVGLNKLVKYIRAVEESLGSSIKVVTPKEIEISKKLRTVDTL